MKRFLLFATLCFLFTCVTALAKESVEAPKSCALCGMDRQIFAQSRMLVVYSDAESVGTCSLHCAAAELKANQAKKVKSLLVADCKNRALVDAKNATWVIGGEKSGVMTDLPKWAFARKEDAEAFAKVNGGKITGFEEAMALARKELD